MDTSFAIELPELAASASPAAFQRIPQQKPHAGGEKDDTVPFDFTFAGFPLNCAISIIQG
jgi:hypothetical protein